MTESVALDDPHSRSGRTPGGAEGAPDEASWTAILALGLGVFAIAMSQFLPASLLPLIAEELDVTIGLTGQSFTATALAAGPSALLVPVLLPRTDRRRLMIGLTLLAFVSNLLVALAPSITVLLAARVLLGISLGGFWAMAIAVTAHLVPAERLGRALTVVNSGVPIATGAAVPLGAWLGDDWGWRAVFTFATGAAALALVMQALTLPSAPARQISGVSALGATLRSGLVQLGVAATIMVYAGHFAGFVYIRPLAETANGIDGSGVAIMLLLFGVANFAGTLLAGPLADRQPRVGVLAFPMAVGAGMLLMQGVGHSTVGLFAAATLWGLGFGGVATSLQSWGARIQPARLEQIGGVLVTAANMAVAVGAVVGGLLNDGLAGAPSPLLGGVAAVAGGLLIASLRQR